MPVTDITSHAQFKEVINSGEPVVIDFWATWCGPCRAISPIFEQMADQPQFAKFKAYKVDVDSQPEISEEVGIRAMPTFTLYQNGQKIGESVGADRGKLHALVEQAVAL